MADDMGSDTTCVGSKRSVEEIEEIQTGSPIPEQDSHHTNTSDIVSPPKQDHDFIPKTPPFLVSDSSKKVKSSPDYAQDMPTSGFSVSDSVGNEVGLSGIQESKKEGLAAAENLLDVKKKQLLEEVEANLVPAEKKVSSLRVEIIDETALIETFKPMGFLGHAKSGAQRNAKQEVNGKKARNQRRKEKLANGFKPENTIHVVQPPHSSGAKKITYSRMELEAMRFVNLAEQRKLWEHVYNGLGPVVAREYDDLAVSKHQKNIQFNSDHRKRHGKMDQAPGILGESLGNSVNNETQDVSLLDPVCSYNVTNEDGYPFPEKECSEDDDSDEEYASIQRPAFLVEGEPNFDSGSPEDGFEYLRRVRWEAAQIPKVRVAKVDRSKFNREQSDYMPKIPEIAKCPEQLLPLKQWEEAFLANFSDLRLDLSRFEGSGANTSQDSQSKVILHKNCSSHQPPVNIVFENFAHVKSTEIDCTENSDYQPLLLTAEGGSASPPVENFSTKASLDHSSRDSPLLSVIFRLDSVARVSMLRKRIKAAEDTSTLSRDDCLWLFALCAVVDTPLDADTSASVRSLLRKCAALRATKSTVDDELIMLNILATISGRYFGQSEN
ncbi:uncharacterized protein LOC112201179 isoform X1 [Rosa chinensis]|uniref:uncharacterized protein LOC112201179 isoform X1 n=1 Tax=Rosa chinensis TaxID=74649 RepID=UPI000D091E64|nr:uncharacterized protein LOC112201179 isoform X1 [Rosa chinensis]